VVKDKNVKVTLCSIKDYVMKTNGGIDIYIYKGVEEIDVFLTSALVGSEWSASRSGHFIPENRSHVLIS
jgi:hypothetical protein